MGYALASDIACCRHEGSAILLDIKADRYFGLAGPAEHALSALVGERVPSDADLEALDGLVARGILRRTGNDAPPVLTVAAAPDASILDADTGGTSVTIGMLARTAWALRQASTRLRSRPFVANLAEIAGASPAVPNPDHTGDLIEQAKRFEEARRYLPFERSCLRDAMAFFRATRHLPTRPSLVIGVRSRPFRAHCWVQCGTLLLTEHVDRARLFTPILVL